MVFSCTKKVLDKVKKYKEINPEKEDIHLHNWYVDLIVLERKNYFLFTNSLTLFSFIIYAGTKKELNNIGTLFEQKLQEQIIREISSQEKYREKAIPKDSLFKFTKTNSRSVLGSMNDFKNHIGDYHERHGDLAKNIDYINHIIIDVPMGAMKYKTPKDIMKKELESE